MIYEVVDPSSGAILFKKDKESLTIEKLEIRVKDLEKINKDLLKRIERLESVIKKDS